MEEMLNGFGKRLNTMEKDGAGLTVKVDRNEGDIGKIFTGIDDIKKLIAKVSTDTQKTVNRIFYFVSIPILLLVAQFAYKIITKS